MKQATGFFSGRVRSFRSSRPHCVTPAARPRGRCSHAGAREVNWKQLPGPSGLPPGWSSFPHRLAKWTAVLSSNSEDNWLFASLLFLSCHLLLFLLYPLQGHTFNFTVFCTLWTVAFNFWKESTYSVSIIVRLVALQRAGRELDVHGENAWFTFAHARRP